MSTTSTTTAAAAPPRGRSLETVLASWRSEIGVGIALVVMSAIFAATAKNFLTLENFTTLLQQTSVIAIIAVGMTMVIITGEIDLSVGSMVGLSGTVFALLVVQQGVPTPAAFLACLAIAVAVGVFIGTLRVVWGIPSFIVTIGLLSALRGTAFYISDGLTISPMPAGFDVLWYGAVAGIPVPVLIMIAVIAVGWIVVGYTRFGRHLYAIGGDAETARRYGVKVDRLRMAVFVIVHLLAACAGVLLCARLNSGSPTVGELMELDVIAAVIVGGTSLAGGYGRIVGTVLGVLFVAVLRNGMILNGFDPVVFLIVQGLVIILAVWWSMLRRRPRGG